LILSVVIDIPHPSFRTDDASNYNPAMPWLGRAGQPYARTVPSSVTTPPAALPDPGLIFDLLLKRDPVKANDHHPGGLSSMFFALANLVIHSIFDTVSPNHPLNSYLAHTLTPCLIGSLRLAHQQLPFVHVPEPAVWR
jgi:linoleate 10R-lipoxygenase